MVRFTNFEALVQELDSDKTYILFVEKDVLPTDQRQDLKEALEDLKMKGFAVILSDPVHNVKIEVKDGRS